ncbi:MAG: HD domain-containing protein, partial [Oscillospiraceae bacterium]|nr:HD domain-containing protein [Oscillospiraceae bacterium]
CFTGDIPTFDKTDADRITEEHLLGNWVQTLPEPIRTEWTALFAEMEERKTLEAKLYKSMDSLEALISHNESALSTWADHEYDLNMVYGYDKVAFSPYLTALRDEIKADTVLKIETER